MTRGVIGVVAIGLAAAGLSSVLPGTPSPLLLALLLGGVIANSAPAVGESLRPGASAIGGRLLRLGIVLLGARGTFDLVAAVGPRAIVVVAVTMAAVFGLVWVVSRRARLTPSLAVLLAVGTAVCGNTAIVAAAPLVRARAAEVAIAVATITLFGTAALIVYPIVGRALDLDALTFGLWAGAGVHDTSQVVATGFALSPEAGEVATIVKLGRNTLMLPILMGIAALWRSDGPRFAAARTSLVLIGGYGAVMAANSLGLLPPMIRDAAVVASGLCLAIAMAAVGLGLRLGELRALGRGAAVIGLAAALAGGLVALAAALLVS